MFDFFQQALALLLSAVSLLSAPLSVLNVPNTAAVGSVYQQEVMHPVMSGLYNATSPTVVSAVGQRQMWLSGMPSQNSSEGVIYTSFYTPDGTWVEPRPVFSVAGQRVSDPFVFPDPSQVGKLRMYYTSISSVDAASTTAVRLNNHIGHAHSNDGVEWVDDGVLIGQNNGFDERGGWAPGAVVVGDEIWLYYSTNYPEKVQVYRTRLSLAGKKIATERTILADSKGQNPLEGFNVDVHFSRDTAQYTMMLNKDFTGVVRYVSNDGLLWSAAAGERNPIIQAASSSLVAAPTVEVVRDTEGREQYNLFFAGGPISKGRFESIYQGSGMLDLGGQVQFLDPKAKDYDTWGSAGVDADSGSGSSGGMGGLLAVGALGVAAIIGFSFLSTGTAVVAKEASKVTGGSFGGRIIAIMPCVSPLGPSVWVTLKPSGLMFPPFMYIWTPATLLALPSPGLPPLIPPTPPVPSLPPRNIGQQLLGRFDIPFSCFVPFPPFVFYGLRMQTMGASPVL